MLKKVIPRSWMRHVSRKQLNEWIGEDKMSRNKKVPMEPTEGFEIKEVMTNKGRKVRVGSGMAMLEDGEKIISFIEKRKDVSVGMCAEVVTSKGRRLNTKNGIVMLDIDEYIIGVAPKKRKEDPAIYNPENLEKVGLPSWEGTDMGRKLQENSELHDFAMCLDHEVKEGRLTPDNGREMLTDRAKFLKDNAAIEVGYANVIQELSETYIKKNTDYGNSFERTLNKRGLTPAIVRMEEKMERMEKLWEYPGEENVVDESIIDTAMDLANYAIMTAMWLKKHEVKTDGVELWADNAKYLSKEEADFWNDRDEK